MEIETKPEIEKSTPREVFFFELEYIATKGRQAMFDAVKHVMKSKEIEVTPVSFSRSGIVSRPKSVIQALIKSSGKKLTTGDQLVAKVEEVMQQFFANKAKPNKDLLELIKVATTKNIEIVAMSAWSKKIAQTLLENIGLAALGVKLEAFDTVDALFPRADHWLRMLKRREQETIPLVAFVSSHIACRGALTAGATCIAIPDAYTAFEEFPGAKLVMDSLGDLSIEEMLELVRRH